MPYHTVGIVALVALPLTAQAEGANAVYRCTDAADAPVSFTISPQEINDRGAGHVMVATADDTLPGVAAGYLGPWSWEAAGITSTLLIDGADGAAINMLHHVLDTTTTPPSSTLTELTCEAAS